MLSPIDGRVADINSRVEWIGDKTEDALDAYARSASEASSYIGVELRRMHDRLAELEESSFEEYYKMRLASAVEMPLERLDEPLAQAINYAAGHQGFFAQAGLWFNPPVAVDLSAGAAAAVQVTERIVEVPFAMAALSRPGPGARILDIGSAESTFPLSAASLGYQITAIDPRPLAYSHPNLESHAALLEDWDAPPASFDAAFLISTIDTLDWARTASARTASPSTARVQMRLCSTASAPSCRPRACWSSPPPTASEIARTSSGSTTRSLWASSSPTGKFSSVARRCDATRSSGMSARM